MSHDATLAIDNGGNVADNHFSSATNNGSEVSYATQVNNTNQQTQKKPGLLDRLKSFGNGVKQYTGNFIAELRPAYARNADNIQTTLDVAGMVPVIGKPADLLNGAISAGRGNYAEAGLSAAAAVPFIGGVATGTKWSRKVLDGADALVDVTKKASQVQSSIPKPGMGNLGNQGPISADTALNSAEKWLEPSYTEIGPKNSGVFRSADGLRQFRMTNSDLDPLGHGAKVEIGPHVHFEALDLHGKVIENMHVPINE